MRGITVYTKNSGMEVRAASSKKEENSGVSKTGKIQLRFFTYGNDDAKNMRFILKPSEAFGLYIKAFEIAKNGGKSQFVHKFTGESGEITTTLTIEKWGNGDKSEYAFGISRSQDEINIPVSLTELLYVAELLKTLSIEQSWSSYKSAEGKEINEEVTDEDIAPQMEEAEIEGSHAISKPAASNGNSATGEIEAVRKDGLAFKMNGEWFKITERTRKEVDEITKGIPVTVYFTQGERDKLANAICPALTQ